MEKNVYINAVSIVNAISDNINDLFTPKKIKSKPLSFDKTTNAFLLDCNNLPSGIYDRKINRIIEPQSHRMLYCVSRLKSFFEQNNINKDRFGISAALPEVDAPSPPWDAVKEVKKNPENTIECLLKQTPPMHSLTLLNTSTIAYIAEAFSLYGEMGGFCSGKNSGIDAIAEAFNQIHEDRSDECLVLSVSPNITPAIYARTENVEKEFKSVIYGEGAAALVLSDKLTDESIELVAYERGFKRSCDINGNLLFEKFAKIVGNDLYEKISFYISDKPLDALTMHSIKFIQSTNYQTGDLGAASTVTDIIYAAKKLNQESVNFNKTYGVIITFTPAGHYGAVLLSSVGDFHE